MGRHFSSVLANMSTSIYSLSRSRHHNINDLNRTLILVWLNVPLATFIFFKVHFLY